MGLGSRIEKGELAFEVADGAHLPFPDNTFDFWTSISVVEHIPGEGDSAVMREACRILKPGGIAVVTTEGGTNPHERWIPVGGYFGKQYEEGVSEEGGARNREEWERMARAGSFALLREYDYERLKERLIDPSGMELVEAGFIDSRFETNFRELIDSEKPHWEGKVLREWTPLICLWSYRRVSDPETHRPRPGATAYAILRKPQT
jgi:SAM-dependent methyltransferase